MFASSSGSLARRRGIVLVVVLGMLGLMALIGVTFATFAGQSLIASRNFGQGVGRPQAEALMDYALAQLINDTNNPLSALRGHSLLRDMYGNDSVYRGSNPTANPASDLGGVLTQVYNPGTGQYVTPQMKRLGQRSATGIGPTPTPFYNQIQFQTNIPTTGQYYGLDFTRWILKIQGSPAITGLNPNNQANPVAPVAGFAAQTYEILEDYAPIGGVHYFTLSNNLSNPTSDARLQTNPPTYVPGDWSTFLYADANYMSPSTTMSPPGVGIQTNSSNTPATYTFTKAPVSLAEEWVPNISFTLDARYMRAFNGPGLTQVFGSPASATTPTNLPPYNLAALANFRVTGFNPDSQGMDEDYDACDLENWFLAIQSADGQVVVPSFHRPGILTGPASAGFNSSGVAIPSDWTYNPGGGNAKILRPRQADNSPLFPADPSTPDPVTGKLTYDIDNDGDGVTDSVWLDLGYSVQRDPGGKLYKPLFAFMVLGLNGRLPLNTVGNLQARANADQTNNANAVDVNSNALANTTGQVPQPGVQPDYQNPPPGVYYKNAANNAFFSSVASSQTYLDAPLWDHASHLGYSVNEINPKFALQNAPSNVYSSPSSFPGNGYAPIGVNVHGNNYSQMDDAGVSVALTQLRNILAGTVPTDITYPYLGGYPITGKNSTTKNFDVNVVMVNGQFMVLPNNMADLHDINPQNVYRGLQPVAGRWGESYGMLLGQFNPLPAAGLYYPNVPYNTLVAGGQSGSSTPVIYYPGLIYNNPIRAGRSVYLPGTTDIMDDDFDTTDPVLAPQYNAALLYYREPTALANPPNATPTVQPVQIPARILPEFTDTFDSIGQRSVASERIRQFVTPIDPSGSGRVVGFMNRPNNDYDFGNGYDSKGRSSFFRYFRTPGMPQEIRYPYGGVGSTYSYPSYLTGGLQNPYPITYPVISNYSGHRFLMPQMFPSGSLYQYYNPGAPIPNGIPTGASDISNNRYHGLQSMLAPEAPPMNGPSPQAIASMGAMPYDWDNAIGAPLNPNGPAPGYPTGYPSGNAVATVPAPSGPPLGTGYVNNFAPTLNPNSVISVVNTLSGPNLGANGNPANAGGAQSTPIGYGYTNASDIQSSYAPVVNGYLGGSLNKDEADEMNLYAPNRYDQPYGPSDLEWLYRLQDVDGATLTSRLSQLAPVSFLNPADGLTRRRLFSTDSWEPTGWVYANDNPLPYAGAAYGTSTDHTYTYNSRFTPTASPSLEIMNQIDANVTFPNGYAGLPAFAGNMANPITTEYLANPTFPTLSPNQTTSYLELYPNSSSGSVGALPTPLKLANSNMFLPAQLPRVSVASGLPVNFGANSMVQVQTPSLAHRDRRINLNYPLPISNEPAEPVRQKWCRETYTLLKAILPPASVDTPEELAALSQYVVNIIDFRDPDCTMTRFVNTDLVVTDALTKTATLNEPTGTLTAPNLGYDTTWNVSPGGVRFANSGDAPSMVVNVNGTPVPTYPYDPNIYSPDVATPFLVQHGMEYNPIAITEALGMKFQYGASTSATAATPLSTFSGLYVELVNTLTEEQNNNASKSNSSAINLSGWDLVLAPDDYGWGRPDPISGDVNTIAYPPFSLYGANTTALQPPANLAQPLAQVKQFAFNNTHIVQAINAGAPNYFVAGTGSPPATALESNNSAAYTFPTLDATLTGFLPTTVPMGKAQYFWVYLRRPANPFDTGGLQKNSQNADGTTNTNYRPNREMVVVDAMRFPFIDAENAVAGVNTITTAATNAIFSARRLQPYRGGHLVPVGTTAAAGVTTLNDGTNANAAQGAGVTTISPPTPASAYGFSEQTCPVTGGTSVYGSFKTMAAGGGGSGTYMATTKRIQQSFNTTGSPADADWTNFPFNDRDFTSVVELLLVPGCPPGLFTKQFVEEPYPGNVIASAVTNYMTAPSPSGTNGPVSYSNNIQYFPVYAAGFDDNSWATNAVVAPSLPTATTNNVPPSGGSQTFVTTTTYNAPYNINIGRPNFGKITPTFAGSGVTPPVDPPVAMTFPYLPDNFYYTAASVAPASSGGVQYPSYYQNLTAEVGGWTGNGWHKMMEFFEVPSSANGATGTADAGVNFDWQRADIKPGLLNLNLIIDEEVFAGLFDDPRLNERLAAYAPPGGSSTIPHIVTQIDPNGYAASQYAIFGSSSLNMLNLQTPPNGTGSYLDLSTYVNGNNSPGLATGFTGRGYVVRDPDSQNYVQVVTTSGATFPYQQLHGLKAAFSDFLKLRHGGSGYLFAHGAGPTGSGDLIHNGTWPVTQPIASDRPYRSLSYPDINYTIMRPASLPPSLTDSVNLPLKYRWTASTPALPVALSGLFSYATYSPTNNNGGNNTYVELFPPIAPRNQTTPFQYTADPGIKNPYVSVQYANVVAPDSGPDLYLGNNTTSNVPPSINFGGPPFPQLTSAERLSGTTYLTPSAAPFPPPIPATPAARLIQVPDVDTSAGINPSGPNLMANPAVPPVPSSFTSNNVVGGQTVAVPDFPSSGASVGGQRDGTTTNNAGVQMAANPNNTDGLGNPYAPGGTGVINSYAVNWPTTTLMLFNGSLNPPTLVPQNRAVFLQDNNTPLAAAVYAPQTVPATNNANNAMTSPNILVQAAANNYLGAGTPANLNNGSVNYASYPGGANTTGATGLSPSNDYRQHPLYRTEMLQKIMNLTTVRTHQFAVWITVGFFEVVKPGTPELGIPDVLGQELGLAAGHNIRYRSFFTLDRTKATGFNPYYPGNFRDCVTYRRRIE